MLLKRAARSLISLAGGQPPRPVIPQSGWFGDYSTFDEAAIDCSGYDQPTIANSVFASRQKSIDGAISHIDERFLSVLAAINIAVSRLDKNFISVIDFGSGNGALADIVRHYIPSITFDWTVIETASMVEACQSIDGINWLTKIPDRKFDIFLFCGSLQYLRDPYQELEKAAAISDWTVIQRLPLGPKNRITRQIVPTDIYPGSYPHTFLCEEDFTAALNGIGKIVMKWTVEIEKHAYPFENTPRGFLVEIKG